MITIIDSIVSSFRKYYPILQSVLDTTDSNLLSDDFIKKPSYFLQRCQKTKMHWRPSQGHTQGKIRLHIRSFIAKNNEKFGCWYGILHKVLVFFHEYL